MSKMIFKQISVLGLGYVGLTLALTFADVGYKVTGIDKDSKKIQTLRNGKPTMYEPKLEFILNSNLSKKHIQFFENIQRSNEKTCYIICVGTPIDSSFKCGFAAGLGSPRRLE